ncbi:MAG: EamA family transporter [Lachnospiraceae bacterium]|nr:EamA family transporter [Lachnospiraceae bacterium]
MSAEDRAAGSSGAAGHTPDTVHTPGTVQNRPQSMVMLATAMLIFGTIGIFRRYIPLSSGLLSFVRGVIGTAFLCLYVKLRGDRISHGLSRREIILLIVSGGLIGVNWILLFEAYNYTTVATATLCYYMEPTIVVLLSPVFFREKLTARKLICAAVAIVGMILVSGVIGQGPAQGNQLRGVIYGLSAAVLYAAVVILNKWLRSINAYEKTIIQLGAAALCLLPYLVLTGQFSGVQLTPLSAVLTLILGLVHTGIAYTLYFGSTDGLKAQTIAVFSYIDPVSALIFAALILREPMSLTACIGAVLILGAAFVSEM